MQTILNDKYIKDLRSYDIQGVSLPVIDKFGDNLRKLSNKKTGEFKNRINISALSSNDKELLNIILLYSLRTKTEGKDTSQVKLNELAKKFTGENPSSEATPFISSYVIKEYEGTGRAQEIAFGGGYLAPQGDLGKKLSTGYNIAADVKQYFNWFIVGLTANISSGHMLEQFTNKDGKVFEPDAAYKVYYLGLDLGARIFESKRFCISLIGGPATSDISIVHVSNSGSGSSIEEEIPLKNPYSAHGCLLLDFKFIKAGKFSHFKNIDDYNHSNFIRLKYEYQKPFISQKYDELAGGMHVVSLCIGFNTKGIRNK